MPIRNNSLDDLKIRRAIGVPPSCPLVEAAALMAREGVPAVLVLENDRPVGVVTERTVVDAVGARMSLDTSVSVLMRQPVPAIAAGSSLVEATALLLSADVGCLGVTDEAGYHVGVLDGRDLLQANERAARRQREADQRLRLMMEAIDDGLWDWNIVEDRFYLNPYSYKALGYEPNAFPINSTTWKALVHPDDLPATWGAVEESVRSGRGFAMEFRYRHADGDWRWVQGRGKVVAWDQAGHPTRMVGSHSDISARKRMEEALRASETRSRSILAALSEGIVVQDAAGHIVACNPAAERILGLALGQMRGRTAADPRWGTIRLDGSPFPEETHPAVIALATGQSQRNAILGVRRPDGSLAWLSVNSEPLRRDGETKPYAVATSFFDTTDHYETEARLHRLSQAVEQSPVTIVMTDLSGTIEYVNPYFTKITGYSCEEAIGQNPRILQAGETSSEQYRQLWNTISAGGTWTGEFHNRRKDGTLYWEQAIIAPIRDAGGRIVQYLAVKQNITEQKRLEDELRQRERYQRAVLDNFPFLVWLKDTESRFLAVNQPFADFCGLPNPEALAGKTDLDIWPRDLAENYRADDRAVLESRRKKVIEEQVNARGEHRWFEAYKAPVADRNGILLGTVGFARDITDSKRMADQLRQSEVQYRQVVDNVKEVIFQTDAEGRWLFLNRVWEEITGFSVADSLGQSLLDYVYPKDRQHSAELFAEMTAGQRDHCRCEARFLLSDGGFRWIEVFARLTLGAGDEILGTSGTLADITARKVAEATTQRALAEARRLAQIRSDFLANMSHEIRTPLNVILGLAQAARQQRCDPMVRRYFEQIEAAGQLLLAVVNDILDFSKIEAGKLTLEQAPFDLGRMIDQVLALVAPQAYGKGLVLVLDEPADLPPIWLGDGFRLSQVLLNLLGNAVKFTDQGGVTLAVRRALDLIDSVEIVFRIEDTGIGMSSEQLERLFQPFQQADSSTTRQFGGTGLGLTICKRLMDLMAGEIGVDSHPGQGSVFEVRVPLQATDDSATMLASWRSVALIGLAAAETLGLSAALRERGFDARELPAAEIGAADGVDLLLLDSGLLAEREVVVAASAALDRGRRCGVVFTPGSDMILPGALRGRVSLIERPLSARRLLAGVPLQAESEPPPAKGRRLAGLRILAVEDNPVNQMVLTELLSQEGAAVTLADHGVQALARLTERGAAVFDVVLTDIQMPEMDGYEATRQIRTLAPGLPVIGLTAHAMPEERNRCLAAGMCDHVAKPIDLDALVAAIRRQAPAVSVPAAITEIDPVSGAPSDSIPGAAATSAESIIDWIALDHHFEGNAELIDQLVALTLQTQTETAAQLCEAADRRDWDRIVHLAHSLKGLCGYFQSQRALDLARRAEQSARQRQPDAPHLARALAAAMDELLVVLAEHRRVAAEQSAEPMIGDDFAERVREFADALRSRRMDACRLAEALRNHLPDDSRRAALEAAIRDALHLEFGAALSHLESMLASVGTGGS